MITTDDLGAVLSSGGNVIDADDDKIGSIAQVFVDDQTGQPAWVTANTGLFGMSQSFVPLAGATISGSDIHVNYNKSTVKDAPRVDDDNGILSPDQEATLYRYYEIGSDDQPARSGSDTTGTTDEAMTRSEEQLHVGTERQQTGKARLRKYIVTENVTQTVPVSHEEVRVEREPITDADVDDALSGPDLAESEHEVTLSAERPVVEKKAVPVERVRLDTDTVTENVPVNEEVRKEEIELDDNGKNADRP